ncbi:hypothetical protein [Thiocapsa marina]|nr:hypothetical protein [Thiocapsa marina]
MVLATPDDELAGLVFEVAREGEREVFEGRYHRRRADAGAQTVKST